MRRSAGLGLEDVASEFGTPLDVVQRWEAGSGAPPAHLSRTLDLMARFQTSGISEPDLPAPPTNRTGAFTDNMKIPVHRWFRYSAGFSAEWVREVVRAHMQETHDGALFDPFAGSGTSLLAAQSEGLPSAGAEKHPFVARVAKAKLCWNVDVGSFRSVASEILSLAMQRQQLERNLPALLVKCFDGQAIAQLEALRLAFVQTCSPGDQIAELIWLAITSILRECSGVGTAQWQYVLPKKSKAKVSEPFSAFQRKIEMMISDIEASRFKEFNLVRTELHEDDARSLETFNDWTGRVSLIVTSPPYPNNYDYADAARLEMTYWGDIESWSDLHRSVRHKLVCSCSQHSAAERLELDPILANPILLPIVDELSAVCSELAKVRLEKGGKKTYHTMIAAYFLDLALVWDALRPLCREGSDVCFVVGDSAPYGVHVPVERWLATLAENSGFRKPRFEKLRDRNVKWKNRKHRVPLHEGRLWLKG